MEEEKKEKGFVIKDRRLFDDSGSIRSDEVNKAEEKKSAADTEESKHLSEGAGPEDDNAPLPEVNFASFILSLSTTAMFHFGDFPDPLSKEPKRNLPAAKQTIDILSILKTKTEGNLDDDEKQLLEGALFELRMRFVKEISSK